MTKIKQILEYLTYRMLLWLTGEDIYWLRGQYACLSALNGVHCDFLRDLEAKHPELANEIWEHQKVRVEVTSRDL